VRPSPSGGRVARAQDGRGLAVRLDRRDVATRAVGAPERARHVHLEHHVEDARAVAACGDRPPRVAASAKRPHKVLGAAQPLLEEFGVDAEEVADDEALLARKALRADRLVAVGLPRGVEHAEHRPVPVAHVVALARRAIEVPTHVVVAIVVGVKELPSGQHFAQQVVVVAQRRGQRRVVDLAAPDEPRAAAARVPHRLCGQRAVAGRRRGEPSRSNLLGARGPREVHLDERLERAVQARRAHVVHVVGRELRGEEAKRRFHVRDLDRPARREHGVVRAGKVREVSAELAVLRRRACRVCPPRHGPDDRPPVGLRPHGGQLLAGAQRALGKVDADLDRERGDAVKFDRKVLQAL